MTDTTEQKALALLNECGWGGAHLKRTWNPRYEALCRAIEQHETDIADLQAEYEEVCKLHEAFRQEVSYAVERVLLYHNAHAGYAAVSVADIKGQLARFIIAKPLDPLAQAWLEAWPGTPEENAIAETGLLLAAIEKRGGKIVWGEG